jgi:hypothetical protein
MPRYAVLLDLDDSDLRPIALVTEHDDAVRVHFAVECGLKSEFRDPYLVREPDGETVRYEPGRDEYFNSVISTLSRGFVVKQIASVEKLDTRTIVELYLLHVVLPRATQQGVYTTGVLDTTTAALTGSYTRAAAYGPEEEPAHRAKDTSALARAA